QAISKYKGTVSGGPNFSYDLCVRHITPEQKESLDLSAWLVAFNGAEPVRRDTMERFAAEFEPCGFHRETFYPCSGLAQATLIVSGGFRRNATVVASINAKELESNRVVDASHDVEGARELVGCGRSLLDQRVVVADSESLVECPPGQVGEVLVKGSSVA